MDMWYYRSHRALQWRHKYWKNLPNDHVNPFANKLHLMLLDGTIWSQLGFLICLTLIICCLLVNQQVLTNDSSPSFTSLLPWFSPKQCFSTSSKNFAGQWKILCFIIFDVAQGVANMYYDQLDHAKHKKSQQICKWKLQ